MEWIPTGDGVELKFRKKVTIDDVLGMVEEPETDAVELKKKVQMGRKELIFTDSSFLIAAS